MNIFKKLYVKALSKYAVVADNRLLKSLMADVSEKDKPFIEPLLKNELACLNGTFTYQAQQKKEREQKEFFMRLTKRIIHRMMVLKNIVGIQPMQGPVGLAYRLQYTTLHESKSIRLEVVKDTVTAIARKLCAGWQVEADLDLRSLHGLDMVAELQAAMGHEVAEELITEVIRDLQKLGLKSPDNRTTAVANRDRVFIAINQAAASIAAKTRRGAGNFVVTSPMGVALLQSDKNIKFVTSDLNAYTTTLSSLVHAGNVMTGDDIKYRVYMSLAVEESTPSQTTFIVGYKGGSGEIDTGYIYSPYVPLMPSGPVINPNTFQPMMALMTRYGKTIPQATEDSSVDASAYYRTVTYDATLDTAKEDNGC